MENKRDVINVSVAISEGVARITANESIIEVAVESPIQPNSDRLDFAVWFVLPVAMRCNADIVVHGC